MNFLVLKVTVSLMMAADLQAAREGEKKSPSFKSEPCPRRTEAKAIKDLKGYILLIGQAPGKGNGLLKVTKPNGLSNC